MTRCVNCGRRITAGGEEQLCSRCAACQNLYEAKVQRLRAGMFRAIRSAVVLVLAAMAIRMFAPGRFAQAIGVALLCYAGMSFLVTAAALLSEYIQLRIALKKELSQRE